MRHFGETLSQWSWLTIMVGFIPLFAIVFQPTWQEFLIFLFVDILALMLIRLIDTPLFLRFFPDNAPFFRGDALINCAGFTVEQQVALFDAMARFPKRRAAFCLAVSFFKAIPAALVILFVWRYDDSCATQLLKLLAVTPIIWAYFYGAIFIENHALVYRKLAELHHRYDWSEAFRRVVVPFSRWDFVMQQTMAMASIWIFMLSLQWILLSVPNPGGRIPVAVQVIAVDLAGLLLMTRMLVMSQNYFVKGLNAIFEQVERFDPEARGAMLPLHASPLLSNFERAFNSMIDKLRVYRRELSHWIGLSAEKSRYTALGEISALIVHDLSGPLHVVKFCVEDIARQPELARDPRYTERLTISVGKALELTSTLRAYLRDPTGATKGARFGDVFPHVKRLLEAHFLKAGLSRIELAVDGRLDDMCFNLAFTDFLHVLFNLTKNSVESVLAESPVWPRVSVTLIGSANGRACVCIEDNGRGMTAEEFERYSAMTLPFAAPSSSRPLGLRLVRRIVEREGGDLRVQEPPPGVRGARLMLSLRLLSEGEPHDRT